MKWPSLTMTRQMIVTVKGSQPELRSIEGLALGDIVAIASPPPPLDWTGGVNAGLVTSGGNTDISTLRLDGEISLDGTSSCSTPTTCTWASRAMTTCSFG